ncbi:similar to Saccharomyces cerevisiae YKL082C RRP14 Essential protein, constituent of 66S pre- ribosomal particles [Maudiozyma barnettii]|uniref:Similar to Saccharomyces cerevisiae YKL082C RRP14 Essential protein, constituent of 66S pre- ribosomal particles n=1 Tax=Maudiozyma barnettii TaxID=61262 RepID=A0A8H2VIC2_9SACH|nr:ribosome biosynthesis protein RRP14 [Kazachstania barnettii]CAB4256085.1 similar to Saccharomyces cerevisiae YKL082C RRP14 Essential protein, constituent of 66S pre- ribosomal particles [Kazachstania barnettii]CAD1784693.1 similar to Saccharomyces cerevisiae YKL082C RRP14 Essential protein, constituent of 66S pre- ribosomal particles [Kazachstania barnettii]
MSNSVEERLRANSNAFDGLLALIPAKYYYDEQTQDQWKAKKKSKDQARDDKAKKLDPNSQSEEVSTALDVMKKREVNAKPVVLPGQRMKEMKEAQRLAATVKSKESKAATKDDESEDDSEQSLHENESIKLIFDDEGNEIRDDDAAEEEQISSEDSDNDKEIEVKEQNFETDGEKHAAIKEAKTVEQKKITEEMKEKKQKNLDALRAKLQSKIQNMRNKRKAPGSKAQGAPASREAILKQRQNREESRKKRQLPEQDDNSDSDSSDEEDDHLSKKSKGNDKTDDINADGVIFQNIMFDDGDRATSDLQRIRRNGSGKKKGPAKKDLKAHLKILEDRKAKLESRDELDQIKQKEKDKWQRTLLQTEGVKIKDDERLLRKALKRKEAKKRKSSIEWRDRKQMVVDTKAERVKRREENLQIRKDNKGVKRSKQQKMKRKFKGVITPKKRAGFEGRLKSGKGRR